MYIAAKVHCWGEGRKEGRMIGVVNAQRDSLILTTTVFGVAVPIELLVPDNP